MQEAIRMAIEAAKARQASRVTRIHLRVGGMSGVVPEALNFAFDVVTQHTIAEGAVLQIEKVAPACWCASCQVEFDCMDFLNECPRCGALSSELRRGRELDLANVEVN
jgi:hydrogenase nickel incorporation protein HypA/HybF